MLRSRAQDAARYAEDQRQKAAATKVTRAHQDRLDREKAATAEALEALERSEWKSKGLETQIDGLLTGQRS